MTSRPLERHIADLKGLRGQRCHRAITLPGSGEKRSEGITGLSSGGALPIRMTPQGGLRRAVFLDRDGVLNRTLIHDRRPYSPSGLHEVEVVPGVPEACERLRRNGFLLVVVTNQPEVARGHLTRLAVEEINNFMRLRLGLDDVRVCYHDDPDGCACRKPKPGMLLAAARDLNIDLSGSFVIGDRWRDIEAGRRAGCKTILIDHGYAEPRPAEMDFATHSLTSAVEWILSTSGE